MYRNNNALKYYRKEVVHRNKLISLFFTPLRLVFNFHYLFFKRLRNNTSVFPVVTGSYIPIYIYSPTNLFDIVVLLYYT